MVYRRARSSKRSRSRRRRTRRAGFAPSLGTLAKIREADNLAELKRVREQNAKLRKELGLDARSHKSAGRKKRSRRRSRRRSRK